MKVKAYSHEQRLMVPNSLRKKSDAILIYASDKINIDTTLIKEIKSVVCMPPQMKFYRNGGVIECGGYTWQVPARGSRHSSAVIPAELRMKKIMPKA